MEHLLLQKSPKLMLDLTLADAQKDTNPMRPEFRFKVVAQDLTPKIKEI